MRKLKPFIIPILITILGILPLVTAGPLIASFKFLSEAAFIAPLVMLLISGILGLRLNQRCIFLASLAFAVFHLLTAKKFLIYAYALNPVFSTILLSLILPLWLITVFFVRETGLRSFRELLRFLILLVISALPTLLIIRFPELFSRIFLVKFIPAEISTLPHVSIVLFVLYALLTLLFPLRRVKVFQYGTILALLPCLFVLDRTGSIASYRISLGNTASALILLNSIFSLYWQKIYLDELTGIPNRRALDEKLAKLTGQFCIAMADVDHFKKFNDNYGHDEGDHVLRKVASLLAQETSSRAFRYGGEEFCIVLESVRLHEAFTILDQAREKLARSPFKTGRQNRINEDPTRKKKPPAEKMPKDVKLSISMGVTSNENQPGESPEKLLKVADTALYKAKESGRNQVQKA